MLKVIRAIGLNVINVQKCSHRCMATHKRFYKQTNVLQSDGHFEITLDQKKLKTPHGTPFVVDNEALAIAVATEWENQKEVIDRSSMHLTSLCNTAIDNPNRLSKIDLVNYIMNYMPTDTVLYHTSDSDDLYELQCKEWEPMINWFNHRYEVNLQKTRDIVIPTIATDVNFAVSRYLMSYDLTALHGFVFAVDTLKSVILAFACVNRKISVERAVHLSRLEEEFQLQYWDRVEWAHDLSQQDLQARLSAAVLFIYLNSSNTQTKEKLKF